VQESHRGNASSSGGRALGPRRRGVGVRVHPHKRLPTEMYTPSSGSRANCEADGNEFAPVLYVESGNSHLGIAGIALVLRPLSVSSLPLPGPCPCDRGMSLFAILFQVREIES
jgi:hypothetical protein